MLAFLSITGSAGNALVLCVFTRRRDNLVSTVYIISPNQLLDVELG